MTGPEASAITVALPSAGQVRTASAGATQAFGARLAASLVPGDVVALEGELGSGKTCLVQGICAALGVTETVDSPTFVLLNVYDGGGERAGLTVYHFDLYRLQSWEELEEIGAGQFFGAADAVCLVEWADRMRQMLPARRWHVRLEHGDDEHERRLSWQGPGDAVHTEERPA